MRTLRVTMLAAAGLALALAACGKSDQQGTATSSNPNAPDAVLQKLVFAYPEFARPIYLRIPADGDSTLRYLRVFAGGSINYFALLRVQMSGACSETGYATNPTRRLDPTVDGYTFGPGVLSTRLEDDGLREPSTVTLTVTASPWGTLQRTFTCDVNTEKMKALFGTVSTPRGPLAVMLGRRRCSRWTFVNKYQTAMPGQGSVQVFAGTFSYTIDPLLDGVHFVGDGRASVKMHLNPDTGQWVIDNYHEADPGINLKGIAPFHGTHEPLSSSCPVQ